MSPRRHALLLLLVALAGCESRRSPPAARPSAPALCAAGELDQRRCSGAAIQRCDGSRWVVETSCMGGTSCQLVGASPQCAAASCAATSSCELGAACGEGSDCRSGACGALGTCVDPACQNNQQDPGETGIDCGGTCPRCFGESCSDDAHCVTGYCRAGQCDEPSCTDGVKNGAETAADCGGDCPPCADGSACRRASDCASGRCVDQLCTAPEPTCTDGAKGGAETDVDCGGSACPGCGLGKGCMVDGDCLSEFCNFGRCDRPTCEDGIRNQGESDVDCGGAACPDCGDGQTCGAGTDCASGRCTTGRCTSCSDGIQNGGEAGVDCGGPCAPCSDGQTCASPTECGSSRCEGGRCRSCQDGLRTGSESDIDCGGPCSGCFDGASCGSPSDCAGGGCDLGRCCTLNRCGTCGPAPQEVCNGRDDDCDGMTDEPADLQAPSCDNQLGVCAGSRARCLGAAGYTCDPAAYANHSAYFETTEAACDNRDNDCNGTVDQIDCGTPDADDCTYNICETGSCRFRRRPDGYPCPGNGGAYPVLNHCRAAGCIPSWAACHCGPGGCTLYRNVTGHGFFTDAVSSCTCRQPPSTVALAWTTPAGQSYSVTCYRCIQEGSAYSCYD